MRNPGSQENTHIAGSWFPRSSRFGGRWIPLNDYEFRISVVGGRRAAPAMVNVIAVEI